MTDGSSKVAPSRPSSRQLLAAAMLLLAAALVLPLWSTRMEAPQYRNEEALEVHVYPGRVEGDIKEIETLNQYVGVALPLDTPELAASPWVLGALLLLAVLILALPERARPLGALALGVTLLVVAAAGGALLQYRLYEMGHARGKTILEGVPDFTPPILGTAKIANFTVHMSLGPGGWAYGLAVVLALAAFVVARRERRLATTAAEQEATMDEASPASRFAASKG